MNIIDWMLTEKIVGHWKQAQNIIAGLHLNELYSLNDYDGIKARARLYRDWRNAGEPSKVAYQKAIAGEPVPAPMFEDVLHTNLVICPICETTHSPDEVKLLGSGIGNNKVNWSEWRCLLTGERWTHLEPVPAPEVTG